MGYKLNDYKILGEYSVFYIVRRNGDKVEFIIDTEDLDKIKNMCWHAGWRNIFKKYYIEHTEYLGIIDGKPHYKTIFLHDYIMDMKSGENVDHISGDTLDNRKENLRKASDSNNLKNRDRKNINNSTGHRNVSFSNGSYLVQLQVDGKNKRLGSFDNPEEAGKFAEKMRKEHYGEFCGK